MRRFVFFTLALALSGCCCNNCSRPTENFVSDVPTTLSDAKKRAQPPSVTVDVQRITKRGGGGGACHSAVCLLFLPVLVYEAAFPEQYDVVTIEKDGTETFSGSYSTGGDLLTGVVHLENGEQKQVLVMQLAALGKNTIVESARLKPNGTDGGFDRTPTPLQPQHDFVADYEQALAREKGGDKRGALLAELQQWLDAEATPTVLKHLKDPAEPDAAKAAVLAETCKWKPPHEAAFVAAVGDQPGPFTALELLGCTGGDARKPQLFERITSGGCALAQNDAFEKLDRRLMERTDVPVPALAACGRADRKALLGLQFKGPVDPKGLAELLKGPHALLGIKRVDLADPAQRGPFFEALGAGNATPTFLEHLRDDDKLSPAELAEVARAFTADRVFFSREREQRQLLTALNKHQRGVDAAPARQVLSAHRNTLKEGDRGVIDAALVLLGDRSHGAAALKAADPKGFDATARNVAAHALTLSGCTPAEVTAGRACAAWK